jgi:DNA-3-methyladenine glycosylase
MTILDRDFYARDTLQVARELLGKRLVFNGQAGLITETEAYIGANDPACHAARGLTPRTKPMFGAAGHAYVYFIYGMYYCLNIVTETEGFPAAVLIRGLWLPESQTHLNGPGKLCRYLKITKEQNEQDLTQAANFCILNSDIKFTYDLTPRIGISKGKDKLWRYIISREALRSLADKQ